MIDWALTIVWRRATYASVRRLNRVRWVMVTSLLKTLACKYDSTVSTMAARYPLGRQPQAVLADRKPPPDIIVRRKELIARLQAGRCEMCHHTGEVQVHHVGKLAHLGKPGATRPPWADVMAKKRRKTLMVRAECHDTIHHRQPTATTTE